VLRSSPDEIEIDMPNTPENMNSSVGFWKGFVALGGLRIVIFMVLFSAGVWCFAHFISTHRLQRLHGFEKGMTTGGRGAAKQSRHAAFGAQNLAQQSQRAPPRRIAQSDHDRIVAALRPYKGSTVVMTKLKNPEVDRFAGDVMSIFSDAGWNVHLSAEGMGATRQYGLHCSVDETSQAGQSLAALLRTLPSADIEDTPHEGVIADISVGMRPPP
jgi:hypothetical protein